MKRRAFIKKSCLACGGGVLPLWMASCATTHYTAGVLETNGISILKSEFTVQQKEKTQTRSYIIIQNDALAFPIYLYRFSENDFSALWMQCSHQGNELQALGDHLHCPAHGSEFNNRGVVAQGPASHPLRSFPVDVSSDKIFIDLRAK